MSRPDLAAFMGGSSEPGLGQSISARRTADRLAGVKARLEYERQSRRNELVQVQSYLRITGDVTNALQQLSELLFQSMLDLIQKNLTIALQEVLEQPIHLRAEAEWKRGGVNVEFWIEREGNTEDIMKGQGGSVANVLSLGLRMFALTTLDERVHRRFLVLDEQDCWIRPDLVPRFVRVVRDAGRALGFQVLMISHHDVWAFEQFADKIYELRPVGDNEVTVDEVFRSAVQTDPE